jgi:probable addiction module antidote protein
MKKPASISHNQTIVRELRDDPKFAAEYLRAALEDEDDPRVLLLVLRQIAESRGGIAKVAKAAGIERESLYRALSAKGNPRLSTLVAVTKAIGLKLTVEAA